MRFFLGSLHFTVTTENYASYLVIHAEMLSHAVWSQMPVL